MPRPLVLVPTYDERENLAPLVAAIRHAGAARWPFAVMVLDDASPDGTGAVADALAASHPGEVIAVHRPARAGLGRAYADGFARALAGGWDPVFQMDCDFSHDPAVLPALAAALHDADVAIGSRYVPGGAIPDWPWPRRMLSAAANRLARAALGGGLRDWTSGFRGFRAEALRALDVGALRSDGYGYQIELAWRSLRAGLRVAEVPIVFRDRTRGRSKLSRRTVIEAAFLLARLRTASSGLAPRAVTAYGSAVTAHRQRASTPPS
ncbi:MAG: polyprenol monophosphomannose synthase [bacterium]|nr:polyprenol monophosphomannose synthase [bacterium]